MNRRLLALPAAVSLLVAAGAGAPPEGNSTIRGKAGPSEIVIITTARLAGAIHSLTWNGKEFIDSLDHGRQLQSASNLDAGTGRLADETYNPTEAGSRDDSAGPTSSSRLLRLKAAGDTLETTTQMAFWLGAGETSGGHAALNKNVLSDHLLTKRVHIGHGDLPHAIEYDVTFTLPGTETNRLATFEVLTGYMPAEFTRFLIYRADREAVEEIDHGPGEQKHPVVIATPNGEYAMGVYCPDEPSPGSTGPTYGRFHFDAEKVNKWNCVFRAADPRGLTPGDYHYRLFVAVGTLEDVRSTFAALVKETHTKKAESLPRRSEGEDCRG